jgi:hypothetical protein
MNRAAHVRHARDEDDRYVEIEGADLTEQLDPIDAGHRDVSQDCVVATRLGQIDGVLAIQRLGDDVAEPAQASAQRAPQRRLVIHDEKSSPILRRGLVWPRVAHWNALVHDSHQRTARTISAA